MNHVMEFLTEKWIERNFERRMKRSVFKTSWQNRKRKFQWLPWILLAEMPASLIPVILHDSKFVNQREIKEIIVDVFFLFFVDSCHQNWLGKIFPSIYFIKDRGVLYALLISLNCIHSLQDYFGIKTLDKF